MPRIRVIKPQFWIDEGLAEVSREARLVYIGLWNLCDDRGVFEFRPAKIRVQLFPYDTDLGNGTVDKWLTELQRSGHIILFHEDAKDYGYIPSFLKHQEIKKPSKWSWTTTLPERDSTPPVPHQSPTSTTPVPNECLEVRGGEVGGKRYEVRGKSKEIKKERRQIELPDFIKRETWDAYIDMRRKQKKPATDYALRKVLDKLGKMRTEGQDPNEVLDQSIMNGWAGVFPVKEGKGEKAKRRRDIPTVWTEPPVYPDD